MKREKKQVKRTKATLRSNIAILILIIFSTVSFYCAGPNEPANSTASIPENSHTDVETDVSFKSSVSIEWARVPGTGQALRGVWAQNSANVWIVGNDGLIFYYNGSSWVEQKSNTTENLWEIKGISNNHIWAVGENGTILYYNGSSWAKQTSPTTVRLRSIWAADQNNVWIGGGGNGQPGKILHFDGNSWQEVLSVASPTEFMSISGANTSHIFAAGLLDYYFWNGSTWQSGTTLGNASPSFPISVWCIDSSNVLFGSTSARIHHFNGSSWSTNNTFNGGGSKGIVAMGGASATDFWALGYQGSNNTAHIEYYNGSSWSNTLSTMKFIVTPGSSPSFYAGNMMVTSNADVWAVGARGAINRYDGSTWNNIAEGIEGGSGNIFGLYGTSDNEYWAGGAGAILKWNGTAWQRHTDLAASSYATEFYGTGMNNIFASINGSIGNQHWNGSSWSAVSGVPAGTYRATWGSGNSIWMVGRVGSTAAVYHSNDGGSSWSNQAPAGMTHNLTSVRGFDQNNVWVGGFEDTIDYRGIIYYYDGTSYTEQFATNEDNTVISDIWAVSADKVWAVSNGNYGSGTGKVYFFNGVSWKEQYSVNSKALNNIWAYDENNAWAVGEDGTIIYYDGEKWVEQNSGLSKNLYFSTGTDISSVWMSAAGGTIYKGSHTITKTSIKK